MPSTTRVVYPEAEQKKLARPFDGSGQIASYKPQLKDRLTSLKKKREDALAKARTEVQNIEPSSELSTLLAEALVTLKLRTAMLVKIGEETAAWDTFKTSSEVTTAQKKNEPIPNIDTYVSFSEIETMIDPKASE